MGSWERGRRRARCRFRTWASRLRAERTHACVPRTHRAHPRTRRRTYARARAGTGTGTGARSRHTCADAGTRAPTRGRNAGGRDSRRARRARPRARARPRRRAPPRRRHRSHGARGGVDVRRGGAQRARASAASASASATSRRWKAPVVDGGAPSDAAAPPSRRGGLPRHRRCPPRPSRPRSGRSSGACAWCGVRACVRAWGGGWRRRQRARARRARCGARAGASASAAEGTRSLMRRSHTRTRAHTHTHTHTRTRTRTHTHAHAHAHAHTRTRTRTHTEAEEDIWVQGLIFSLCSFASLAPPPRPGRPRRLPGRPSAAIAPPPLAPTSQASPPLRRDVVLGLLELGPTIWRMSVSSSAGLRGRVPKRAELGGLRAEAVAVEQVAHARSLAPACTCPPTTRRR